MSADAPSVSIVPAEGETPGATVEFPFDRATVEQFRTHFPRARWRDDLKAWFVPGPRAADRLGRWADRELAASFRHADERGRDAFAFEPIESRYLEAGDELRVRTPYSRSIVAAMREIPFAAWDGEARAWRIPFRSWDALRRRWPEIEAAARRNEPEARRARAVELRASPAADETRARLRERRRRRYPVPLADLPPLGAVVMTRWGAACFVEIVGECVEADDAEAYGFGSDAVDDLVWARWRSPTLAELVASWPARAADAGAGRERGWWRPSREELRAARAQARSRQRSHQTRASASRTAPESGAGRDGTVR